MSMPNPYYCEGDTHDIVAGWYWYDETGEISERYETEAEAKAQLDLYIDFLNGKEPVVEVGNGD